MPLMSLYCLIIIARISTHMTNKFGATGSPCLQNFVRQNVVIYGRTFKNQQESLYLRSLSTE